MPKAKKPHDRKRKYGEPTSMLAVRVPLSLDKKLRSRARKLEQPKSVTAVQILAKGLKHELDVAPDLDVREEGVFG